MPMEALSDLSVIRQEGRVFKHRPLLGQLKG